MYTSSKMTVVNSAKVVKTRAKSQTSNAFSCQIFIDSFSIAYRGFVYFMWASSDAQIQSLRYESQGRAVKVKETLTLSVRLTSRNGKQLPFSTTLQLLTEEGELLDQFEILINQISGQFKDIEAPMYRGLVILKARRRQMNINQQQITSSYNRFHRSKVRQDKSQIEDDYENLQEQLSKTRKKLQDEAYLNNKLKNDRDVLLSTKQQLQLEIQTLLMQMTKEISALKEHYDTRITIREHAYEQQIQSLLGVFNSNSDQSKKMMEMVVKQKIKTEEEVKPLSQKILILQFELANHKAKQFELQAQKQGLYQKIKERQTQISKKDQQIVKLQIQSQDLQITVYDLKNTCTNLQRTINTNQQLVTLKDATAQQLNHKLNGLIQEIKNKDLQINQLYESLQQQKGAQQLYLKEKQLGEKERSLRQQQYRKLQEEMENLVARLQEYDFQFEFNQNVITQLKKQYAQKEQELYAQIENLEQIYAKKIDDIMAASNHQKEIGTNNMTALQQERDRLADKVKELQQNAQGSNARLNQIGSQLDLVKSQLDLNLKQISHKDKKLQEMQEANAKLTQQIHQLTQRIDVLGQQKLNKQNQQLEQQKKSAGQSQKIIQLEETIQAVSQQNQKLKQELQLLKHNFQSVNQQMNNIKKQSNELQEEANKKINQKDYKGQKNQKNNNSQASIGKSRKKIEKSSDKIDLSMQQSLDQKKKEIDQLRTKIEQIQEQYKLLLAKLNKIIQRYPDVDMTKIQADLAIIPQAMQIQQYCQSQQEEEKKLNRVHSHHTHSGPQQRFSVKNIDFAEDSASKFDGRSMRQIEQKRAKRLKSRNTLDQKGQDTFRSPGYDRKSIAESQHSNISYVRVSHTKKIQQLQAQVQTYKKQLQGYKKQVQGYKQSQQIYKKQLQRLQILIFGPDAVNSDAPMSDEQIKQSIKVRVNKQSPHSQEQQQKIRNLMAESQVLQTQNQKMHLKVGQLEDKLREAKMQFLKQSQMFQFNNHQAQRKQQEVRKKTEQFHEQFKNSQRKAQQLQQKLRKQKDLTQQANIKIKQLTLMLDSLNAQLAKLKKINENLQDKLNKTIGNEIIIRDLSKQIQDLNKKALQQTRNFNHLRLEKDSIEEQLRLLKKRQGDHMRIAHQWQEKANSLERAIEQGKKREQKLRREVQEAQEDVRRAKVLVKKAQEEAQSLTSAQVGWQNERRKYMDQINSVQDQNAKKDYQYTRLSKEVQRWKLRAQEKDQLRMGRKNQLKQQIQRLQNELIRRQKRVLQQSEQNKLLRGRLQLLQRENKRIMQQKNQTYTQKLRYYVDETTNIKKLLEEYQNQNSRLKIDNNQLYQQGEQIRLTLDRVQIQYEEAMDRQEAILNDMQGYVNQNSLYKDRINQAASEIDKAESIIVGLRREVDQGKLHIKKLTQQLQNLQRKLERITRDQRQLKVRLSQLQTKDQISGKIGEKYKHSQRRRTQLQEQCHKRKVQLENLINVYVYKRQDLQNAINQTRAIQRRNKEQQMAQMNEENIRVMSIKNQRLQQQVLDSYNQNNRLRNQIQSLIDQNCKLKKEISELQVISEKYTQTNSQLQNANNKIQQLLKQLNNKTQRLSRAQTGSSAIAAQTQIKNKQVNALKLKNHQLQQNIKKLTQEIDQYNKNKRQLEDNVSRTTTLFERQKGDIELQSKQRQMHMQQQYKNKIIQLQAEIQKAKDKEAKSIEDNSARMKNFQQKVLEMQAALNEKTKTIENAYLQEIQQLQGSLMRLSEEIEQKIARNQQLNQAVIILEQQNKELSNELNLFKNRYEDQKIGFEQDMIKLKNKLKETQSAYSTNLKQLQQQISKAQSQTKNLLTNSRIKASDEQRIAKRYEQKMKTKDKKLQQLKQNILSLEETIMRMKKKQTVYDATVAELDRLNQFIGGLQKQKNSLEQKFAQEINRYSEIVRELKRDLMASKESQEKNKLITEQKQMQNQSMSCQLKTLRELYQELQRELQRRKNNLATQMEEQSTLQMKLRTQEARIAQLEQKLLQMTRMAKDLQIECKRRQAQIRKNIQTIEEIRLTEAQSKDEVNNLSKELANLKKNLNDQTASSQTVKAELRLSKNQLTRLRKNQQDLKNTCLSKQEVVAQLKKINQQLKQKWRNSQQFSRKYNQLNEKSRKDVGCSLEDAVQTLRRERQDHQVQLDQLIEQIQELKFLNQRKFMDYDELKRQNLQLQIKAEDLQVLNDQLDALRKICDKLEQEKKNTIFREQVLRMQIENLANTNPQLRNRIQSILDTPENTSNYANFSFY